GDIKAAVGVGGILAFVTVHPENYPTGIYRLDADKVSLNVDALPQGGTALTADGQTLWAGGTDKRVYKGSAGSGTPTAVGPPPPCRPPTGRRPHRHRPALRRTAGRPGRRHRHRHDAQGRPRHADAATAGGRQRPRR